MLSLVKNVLECSHSFVADFSGRKHTSANARRSSEQSSLAESSDPREWGLPPCHPVIVKRGNGSRVWPEKSLVHEGLGIGVASDDDSLRLNDNRVVHRMHKRIRLLRGEGSGYFLIVRHDDHFSRAVWEDDEAISTG